MRPPLFRAWSNTEVLAPAFKELSPQELAALEEEAQAADDDSQGDSDAAPQLESACLAKHAAVLSAMKARVEQLKEDYQRASSAHKSPKPPGKLHKSGKPQADGGHKGHRSKPPPGPTASAPKICISAITANLKGKSCTCRVKT